MIANANPWDLKFDLEGIAEVRRKFWHPENCLE
jgi:hypothetical protein